MGYEEDADQIKDYLRRIKDVKDDHCWFCGKSPDQIRNEYFKYMEHPIKGFEDVDLDDLAIITYKLKKPVCDGCYFAIKKNLPLIKEIIDRPEDEVWG